MSGVSTFLPEGSVLGVRAMEKLPRARVQSDFPHSPKVQRLRMQSSPSTQEKFFKHVQGERQDKGLSCMNPCSVKGENNARKTGVVQASIKENVPPSVSVLDTAALPSAHEDRLIPDILPWEMQQMAKPPVRIGDVKKLQSKGYKMERTLGCGTSSQVILVHCVKDITHKRACKLFSRRGDKKTEELSRKFFLQEMDTMSRVHFPFVLWQFQAFVTPNNYVLVLPFFPRGDLHSRLEHVTTEDMKHYFVTLARAVLYLHDNRIAHRDIKASNVVISVHNQPVLIDFGVSHVVPAGMEDLGTGVLGTPGYMAPEIHTQGRYSLFKADTYALGVTLLAMAERKEPCGSASSYLAKVDNLTNIHEVYRWFLQHLLQPDPCKRWSSAVLDLELQRVREGEKPRE